MMSILEKLPLPKSRPAWVAVLILFFVSAFGFLVAEKQMAKQYETKYLYHASGFIDIDNATLGVSVSYPVYLHNEDMPFEVDLMNVGEEKLPPFTLTFYPSVHLTSPIKFDFPYATTSIEYPDGLLPGQRQNSLILFKYMELVVESGRPDDYPRNMDIKVLVSSMSSSNFSEELNLEHRFNSIGENNYPTSDRMKGIAGKLLLFLLAGNAYWILFVLVTVSVWLVERKDGETLYLSDAGVWKIVIITLSKAIAIVAIVVLGMLYFILWA